MESITPSHLSRSKEKKPSLPLSPPIKSLPSRASASLSDQIATPEKPIQLPRRTRNRSVAFSLKEVKKIAQGLQRTNKGSTNRSDLVRSGEDLVSVEEPVSKPSRARTPVKLPEKYEMLAEFFNSMESSIRLLRLKGSSPTFPNICNSIQNLTERRFTYGHLAQLKYVLPEAISIRKLLLRDEATCCMKPELHVTLQVDAIGKTVNGKEESGYSILRRVFRERLADFSKQHPEGDEIPEEQLPHPFNQTKPTIPSNASRDSSTHPPIVPLQSNTFSQQQFAVPSHISQSFQRRFSQKIPIPDAQKTSLTCYNKASSKDDPLCSVAPSLIKFSPNPPLSKKSLLGCPSSRPSSSSFETREKETEMSTNSEDSSLKELNVLGGTPAKLVSTPARLMSATPEIQTPKRCRLPMDYDSLPLKKSAKRSARTKLFTTPTKNATKVDEENKAGSSSVDDGVINFLPVSLLQSVREKEGKASEERNANVAETKRRQKLIACLPNMFDMILLIFQSWKRSVMTKQELIHKIIASHCKIVDRSEVEEQLKLLEELIPDWISEKTASSGDILCCVNKISSPEELRQRLAEAE